MRAITLFIVFQYLLILICGCAKEPEKVKAPDSGSELQNKLSDDEIKNKQQEAIDLFLSQNNDWRIAETSDNKSRLLEKYQNEFPGYEPYFVSGDMTGDEIEDFAVALKRGEEFGVVFFWGRLNNKYIPQWITQKAHIINGGLFAKEKALWLCGEFYTDNIGSMKWDENKSQMVFEF